MGQVEQVWCREQSACFRFRHFKEENPSAMGRGSPGLAGLDTDWVLLPRHTRSVPALNAALCRSRPNYGCSSWSPGWFYRNPKKDEALLSQYTWAPGLCSGHPLDQGRSSALAEGQVELDGISNPFSLKLL